MDNISIITTADGSHSLYNKELEETYHSVHGAVQESRHVFIKQGLEYFSEIHPQKRDLRILEIGFGTGLNAFLSEKWSTEVGINIYYQSLEKFPLDRDLYEALNYASEPAAKSLFFSLHTAPWDSIQRISPTFILEKRRVDLLSTNSLPASWFDIVFYDAFAPSKQPALWSLDILKKTTDSLCADGVWVTYCAKGQLKRDLKALHLEVQSLPGPPGKREMLRAVKRVI